MRILCVCLGNICRSPLAEGILRQRISEAGLDWMVDSCGTASYHVGESPDPRSVEIGLAQGIDIRAQRARQWRGIVDYADFQLILAMDRSNQRDILRDARDAEDGAKVQLLLSYLDETQEDVPDPYYTLDFAGVYDLIDRACKKLIEHHQ